MTKLERSNVEKILALTPVQEGILFHHLRETKQSYYHEQLSLELEGYIDGKKFKETWAGITRKNDMLRTLFRWEKITKPTQIVLKKHDLDWQEYNLQCSTIEELSAELHRIKKEDKNRKFAPDKQVPFRVTLCKTGESSATLLISYHHILLDGWSLGVILEEFFETYAHLINGKRKEETIKPSFQEFIKWLGRQNSDRQKAFWSEYLQDCQPRELTIKETPGQDTPIGTEDYRSNFPNNLVQSIEDFSAREHLTPGTLLFTAWGLLLERYNYSKGAIFGTTVSGRQAPLEGVEKMVGLFINTVPLKVQPQKGQNVRQLLKSVGESLNQRSPFEHTSLAEINEYAGLTGGESLFDTLVVIENYPLSAVLQQLKNSQDNKLGLEVLSHQMEESTPYDLTLGITWFKGIECHFQYPGEKLPRARIVELANHFAFLVGEIVSHPHKKIEHLDIMAEEEKHFLLYTLNETSLDYPRDKHISQLFREQAGRRPDRIALTGSIHAGGRKELCHFSYHELDRETTGMAGMMSQQGIGQNNVIAIMTEASAKMVVDIWAVLKTGAAYLCLDPDYPEERIAYMLADSGAEIFPAINRKEQPKNWRPPQITSTTPAYIVYTSGSTGRPKGVLVEQGNLTAYLTAFCREFHINHRDISIQQASPAFDTSVEEIYPVLIKGGRLAIPRERGARAIADLTADIDRFAATYISVSPLVLNEINSLGPLASVRLYISGADVLRRRYFQNLAPTAPVYNTYGPTEATVCATYYRCTGQEDTYIPIGKPAANYAVHILDRNNRLQPPGVPGELCVSGPGVSRGYLNNPELTAEKFFKNPGDIIDLPQGIRLYRTGDLACIQPDGLIQFLGRIDRQVKIRGYRVELEELEGVLLRHDSIKEAAVKVFGPTGSDTYICAYLTIKGKEKPSEQTLRDHMATWLPGFMIPSFFMVLDKLPQTTSGKIDRKALKEPTTSGPGNRNVAPETPIQRELSAIWGLILPGASILSIDDNFFHRGGHSLKALSLVSAIEKKFRIRLSLDALYHSPTIRGLARLLEEQLPENQDAPPLREAEKREYYPLSPAQLSFYEHSGYNQKGTLFNTPLIFPLDGQVNLRRVGEIINTLIQRHEILRSSFHILNGSPIQRIHLEVNIRVEELSPEEPVNRVIKKFVKHLELNRPPLMRAGLLNTGPGQYLVLIDMHHLVTDGVSANVLLGEFMSLYKKKTLKPAGFQYKDFVMWQRSRLHSGELKKQEDFWLTQLAGDLPILDLPTDSPRPVRKNFSGHSFTFYLDEPLSEKIRALSVETGTTLYMVLLTAYAILLQKTTGSEDMIIGSPAACRTHPEFAGTVGPLLNSLAMRIKPAPGKTVKNVLLETRQTVLQATENQAYPFEELLKKIQYKKVPGRNPITDVALNVLNMIDRETAGLLKKKENDPRPAIQEAYLHQTAKLDITISALETGIPGPIPCVIEYAVSLFKRSSMEGFVARFKNILAEMTADPSRLVTTIDLFSEEEKQTFLGESYRCMPLSHAQRRIYRTEITYPETRCNNLAISIRYHKEMDTEKLTVAIQTTIAGNPILSTRIIKFPGTAEPYQYHPSQQSFPLEFMDFRNNTEQEIQKRLDKETQTPFPLYNSNLAYFAVIRYNERESGYFLKLHHLVADGWTFGLFFKAVDKLYTQLLESQKIKIPKSPSYADFIEQEALYLVSPEAAGDREFWHNAFLPLPDPFSLSPGKDTTRDIRVQTAPLAIPADLRESLHRYHKERGHTIYTQLFSAMAIYISRFCRTQDLVIGNVGHNRTNGSQKRTMGMHVSTIPLRVQVDESLSYENFLDAQGDYIAEVLKDRQKYPFDLLMDELSEKEGARTGDFLQINLVGHGNLGGKNYSVKRHFPGEDPSPLTLHINLRSLDKHGILEIQWDYQTALFTLEQIHALHRGIVNTLTHGIKTPSQAIGEIEILSPAEKQELLYPLNSANIQLPPGHLVSQRFARQAALTPDGIAITGPATGDNVNQCSFRELDKQAGLLAGLLREKGAGTGSIVAIMAERSVEMITGLWAVLKAGAAYLPLDPDYPAERLNYMLTDSDVNLLIKTTGTAESWSQHRPGHIEIINMATPPLSEAMEGAGPARGTDPAYIIYTSGSTGRPKGVLVEHQNIAAYLWSFQQEFPIIPKDIMLQQASYSFDTFGEEIYPALLNGAKIAIPKGDTVKDINRLTDFIHTHSITIVDCSPLLLNELDKSAQAAPVRLWISGGDALRREYATHLLQKGRAVYNTYGPTETTICATYAPCGQGESGAVPIGIPFAGYSVHILDSRGRLLPQGAPGELCISGIGVSRGYLNNPESTAGKFISDHFSREKERVIFRTGDLARRLPCGNIEFLGRLDRQVKIRGFRIELGEIESQLRAYHSPTPANVAVIDLKTTTGDTFLCAYMAAPGKNGEEAQINLASDHELRDYLAESLPDHMIPSRFTWLEKLPLTPNGKIDSKALREIADGEIDFTPPKSPTEKKCAEIWADLLHLEEGTIGVNHSFFQLGGHSLKAGILTTRLHEEMDVKIPLAEIFMNETLGELAAAIDKMGKNKHQGIEPIEKKEYYPLSSAQKRLYFIQQLDPLGKGYNMPAIINLGPRVDGEKLEKAILSLIARHESLRTSIVTIEGEPVQRVHRVQDIEFDLKYLELDETAKGPDYESMIHPFELSHPPLIRSTLIKLPGKEYAWFVDMHHIISDGTSVTVLAEEFQILYEQDKEQTLPELTIQYKDFACRQNRLLAEEGIENQKKYWLDIYSDARNIPPLDLLTDYARPKVFTYTGEQYRFRLEGESFAKFNSLAGQNGATLYMNLLAALNTLFYKYTGRSDIIIGTGIAGRSHADLQRVIGMFVNTLAMRNYPSGEKTYRNFLKEVANRSLNAFENQDLQFEELVELLELERNPGRNPLFDITMIVQNFNSPGGSGPLKLEFKNTTAKFDMTFFVHEDESGEGVEIILEYYTGIFAASSIRPMVYHLQHIIERVAQNPEIPLQDLEIMGAREKADLLQSFNKAPEEFPADTPCHELFARQVAKTPNAPALVDSDLCLSYGELNHQAGIVAGYLHNKDVQMGECVGIMTSAGATQIAYILGILKVGATFVPLDPALPGERLAFMIRDAAIQVLLSEKQFIKSLNHLLWECDELHRFLCADSYHIDIEEEVEVNQLRDQELWHHVGEQANDDITGGGWLSSYTGQPIPREEMDEYGDNIVKKLTPLLNPGLRVLEIGCASGITMFRLAKKVGFYYGTDLSQVIIEKNRQKARGEGYDNIALETLPAHHIDKLKEKDFDLIIINSVIQCFDGHNYLLKVLKKAMGLLKEQGHLFMGDVMDLDTREVMIAELEAFKIAEKKDRRDSPYSTKTDFSAELFLPRLFWHNLAADSDQVLSLDISEKIHTIPNELTRFRYDVLIAIHKQAELPGKRVIQNRKYRDDARNLPQHPQNRISPPIHAASPAYVIYTSGTTGKPKGVPICHNNLSPLLHWGFRCLVLGPGDRVLKNLSYHFDWSVWELFITITTGAALHIIHRDMAMDPEAQIRFMEIRRITALHLTPTQCGYLLKDNRHINSLKRLFIGAEKLTPHLAERALAAVPDHCRVFNMYGPTEATIIAAALEIFPKQTEGFHRLTSVPIGSAVANATLPVLDPGGNLCPPGAVGELYIGGDGLSRGYLNNPELSAERFISGILPDTGKSKEFYKTGDRVRSLPGGNLEFLERVDQQVKIRGFRIELGEIENRLMAHGKVEEALVIAREDRGSEKYLCAYVMSGPEQLDELELREYLVGKLPGYMVPAHFLFVDSFPLNANGKIDLNALPQPGNWQGNSPTITRNLKENEKALAEVWSQVLGVKKESIGPDHSFFEIGGHSLKAAILTTRIHECFDVKIPLVEIFKRQTLAEQAELLAKSGKNRHIHIALVEKKEYYPLSSAQKRLHFLQQMDPQGTAYNMPLALALDRDFHIEKLEAILKQLMVRHESLRTSFLTIEGETVQRVHSELPFQMERFDLTGLDENKAAEKEDEIIRNFVKPFDLTQAPLLRSGLIEHPGGRTTWIADMHHIIADGTSASLLTAEFNILSNNSKGESPLPHLPIRYIDFSNWQNRMIAQGGMASQQDYWKGIYPDAQNLPALDLITDFPRPDVFTFQGDHYTFRLEGEKIAGFKTLGARKGGTLYINLLAALNTLFYKYTGQTDIVLGTGIAGRSHAGLQDIIGMFVNTLAMRNQPHGELTYSEFLRRVIGNCVAAFDNQDLQFEELVEALELERDPSRNPLFDISMVVQNFTPFEQIGSNKNDREQGYHNRTAKFDMTFFIHEEDQGDDLLIDLEYYTPIFSPRTIEQLATHFKRLVYTISQYPDIPLKEISLISAQEKLRVINEFNATHQPFERNATIQGLFKNQMEQAPHSPVLVDRDLCLTYHELDRRAGLLASYLAREKGVRPGEGIGIYLGVSHYRLIAILGVLKAGAAYIPIAPDLPMERVKYMIRDAAIGIVISEKAFIKTLNNLQWECSSFHTYLCLDSRNIAGEEEQEQNELMDRELWRHVGEKAEDDITGGGWISSFTGLPLSKEEMDQYGDNILKKLTPLLHRELRVLEIGCASGISMYRIAPKVKFYYGTDLSEVIIAKNKERVAREGYENIALAALPAHHIDRIEEDNFDLIIINSVIQCFHGHNYLKKVIQKALALMAENGRLFIGDIMDQDKKEELIHDLKEFKRTMSLEDPDKTFTTKTDFSSELFLSRDFWLDLAVHDPQIKDIEFSGKIHTIENELTRYRYDALFTIDKSITKKMAPSRVKIKSQDDACSLDNMDRAPLANHGDPQAPAYIIYTSGTSGKPKGVAVEQASLVNLCTWHNRYYRVDCRDRATLYAGFGFDASVWELFPYLVAGACVHMVPREIKLDLDALNTFFMDRQISIAFLPTQICQQFMAIENHSLRILLTGGDKLLRAKPRSYALYNNYGPTENTVVSTVQPVSDHQGTIPIGLPMDNTRVFILDRENRELQPPGVPGELCIAGTGLARGYLNNPQLTAEKFELFAKESPVLPGETRIYRTGDLARRLGDGRVEFCGRVDQQVKIRGYRIEPGEIEKQIIDFHKALIKEALVMDWDDGKGGKYLCAYMVTTGKFVQRDLQNFLADRLPAYMIPGYFTEVPSIPLTGSGKVNRKALPRPEISREGYLPPDGPIEETMAQVWQEVLGVNQPGSKDNFFEIGGDSIKAIQVISRLKSAGLELKISDLFLKQTIKDAAICTREISSSEPLAPVYLSGLDEDELTAFEDDFSDIE